MIAADLYAIAAVLLFGAALIATVLRQGALQRLIALNVMGSAVFLFLITLAQRSGGVEPDPVPHAMVLTGIVVAVSITAFAVGLLRRVSADEETAAEEPRR
jgi:multicomponent Na+:H+ antiporter subunit C